ncbi:TonB-dependent receptor, partial [Klebsiella pneumoniae]|nr:TonB-dependent receptor [Klebsiella pneumoniae]
HHWGSFPARSEVGLQLRHDRIRVGLFDTQDRQIIGTTRVDDVRETLVGAYGQTAVELAPKLRGLFGLRADRVDARVTSLLEPR